MSEPRHRELRGAADAARRESRTEALLVDGLDQYFLGHFEEAIHLWTRVLFIDRTHARARAYINRARTAQGERLRRADEMLHAAGDLLDRGELDQARRLLVSAEQASGADEQTAALWARLERVERTRNPSTPARPVAVVDARPLPNRRHLLRAFARSMAAAAFGILLFTALDSPVVSEWIAGRSVPPAGGSATPPRRLDVLSGDEVALVRARNLYARGRLTEALAVLDRVETTGGHRDTVDQLRVEIQRWLLMPRRSAPTAAGPSGEQP